MSSTESVRPTLPAHSGSNLSLLKPKVRESALMKLEQYMKNRAERLGATRGRPTCWRCRKPEATCFCSFVVPFATRSHFAILIHHGEFRRGIATGRMAHLCLTNSSLLRGEDFSHHETVESLIADPANYPVVLAPGPRSVNLSQITPDERRRLFPENRQPVVFVIDGTWAQARKMRRLSQNLLDLPSICFTPPSPSAFFVRKQPAEYCYSTLEAIHQFVELTEPPANRVHDNMLDTFGFMVNQQLDYELTFAAQVEIMGSRHVRNSRARRLESQPDLHNDSK